MNAPDLARTPPPLEVSTAELIVLLAALSINTDLFVEGSELMQLSKTVLYRRISAARESLILRRLVNVQADDSLSVTPAPRALLMRSAQARIGFQLMHARAGGAAERAFFSVTEGGTIAHHIHGNGEHVIQPLAGPAAILSAVMQTSQLPASPARSGEPRVFRVPGQVLAELAQIPPRPQEHLLSLLTSAGLAPAEAEALLRAGLQPRQQSVFSALSVRGQAVGTGSVLWFADERSGWILSNFNRPDEVTLQVADNALLGQALAALIAQALGTSLI